MVKKALIVVSSACVFFSCAFDSDSNCRISGAYYLTHLGSNNKFYLHKDWEDLGGGIIEGTVRMIGWSDRYILVNRKSLASVDKSGWMIVDMRTDEIIGPIDSARWDCTIDSIGCEDIIVEKPQVKWEKLGCEKIYPYPK